MSETEIVKRGPGRPPKSLQDDPPGPPKMVSVKVNQFRIDSSIGRLLAGQVTSLPLAEAQRLAETPDCDYPDDRMAVEIITK